MSKLTLFDGYEIAPVRRDYHDNSCEVCAPSEAHFWTLYGHMPDGEVQAISDLKTKADCEALLYRITGHRDYFLNAMAEEEGDTVHDERNSITNTPQPLFTDLIARFSTASTDLLTRGIMDLRRELENRPDANCIFSVWQVEDVSGQRPDLTEEQCREVLRSIDRGHDANIGINWDVIDIVADLLFPEPDNLNELRNKCRCLTIML